MTAQYFLELIEDVRIQVQQSESAVMVCRWAEICAKSGKMTLKEYFEFKTKLGMGH